MKIESPRFGTLTVDSDKIIDFPEGLAGFEACRRFTLFHPTDAEPKYFILQSLDDAEVAFHIADPARFGVSFEITLSDAEIALLKLDDPLDAMVVVILWKDDAESSDANLHANINAPLVLNLRERRGLQHVSERLNYTTNPI